MYRKSVKRGELYYANLNPTTGCEQGGVRPVLIVQNDMGNKYSPTVIAAAITSRTDKPALPTHIPLNETHGLLKPSTALLEQIRTLDKRRLINKIGALSDTEMKAVDKAIMISFGVSA